MFFVFAVCNSLSSLITLNFGCLTILSLKLKKDVHSTKLKLFLHRLNNVYVMIKICMNILAFLTN